MRKSGHIVGRVAAVAALVTAAIATSVPNAGAAGDKDDGWIPFEQADVTYQAGTGCDFTVTGTVVRDQEFFKNVSFYADGTVHTQLFKGPLWIRWTNTETGESVLRDQSGRAILEYAPDGSLRTLTAQTGHFSARMPAGSSPSMGVYYVGGKWSSLDLNADGTRTIVLGPDGTAENLCETLAG